MSRLSMMAWSSFSSARYVRSITAPLRRFLSLVRTNAPPLPGLTCWNSTTLNKPSGRFRLMPFFRSLVETAMNILRESSERPAPAFGHHQGVLHTDATQAGEVYTGLDGDDEAASEDSSAELADRRRLVDVEPHTVAGPVLEAVGPAGVGDDGPAHVIHLFGGDAGLDRRRPGRLGGTHHREDPGHVPLGLGVHAEGASHVRAVALERGTEIDHHQLTPAYDTCPGVVVCFGRVPPRRDDRLEGRAPAHG